MCITSGLVPFSPFCDGLREPGDRENEHDWKTPFQHNNKIACNTRMKTHPTIQRTLHTRFSKVVRVQPHGYGAGYR